MECKDFKDFIGETNLSGLTDPPDELKQHLRKCGSCSKEYQEARGLGDLLASVKTPDIKDEYWNGYLGGVMSKIKNTKPGSTLADFYKTLLIPAAAALLLFGVYFSDTYMPLVDEMIYGDESYTSSLDFIMNEHSEAMSKYLLNTDAIFLTETLFPDTESDSGTDIRNNQ
ncbi:hypothetical protein ACFL7D_10350 [candidate division KSB1 bacterium]